MFLEEKDRIRANLNKYTRKAFEALPPMDRPRILEIGCGSGVPTLELARLSNGEITTIDVAQPMVEWLSQKVEKTPPVTIPGGPCQKTTSQRKKENAFGNSIENESTTSVQ